FRRVCRCMLAVLARLTFAAREAGTLAHLALRFGAGGTKRAGSWFVVHCNIRRPLMRIKLLVAAAGFAAFATPSLAAEFYIVQDTTTKRCTIGDPPPKRWLSWVRECPLPRERKPRLP